MTTDPNFAAVIALAARMHVTIEAITSDGQTIPQWNGQRLAYDPTEPAAYLFHELAHWAIAQPAERAIWDFGLGPSETYRGFADTAPHMVERVEGRDLWVGQLLLPKPVCTEREGDAVTAFLLMPGFGCATASQAYSLWAEFGGDLDETIDWHRASFERAHTAMAAFSETAGCEWQHIKNEALAIVAARLNNLTSEVQG